MVVNVAEVQRDATRTAGDRSRPDPDDLAGRTELVEPARRVGADAPRQHGPLPQLHRQREALERNEDLAQALDPGSRRCVTVDALPGRQEDGQRAALGRLYLAAQHGERRAAQATQDLRIAPFALAWAGPRIGGRAQLAADQQSASLELAQRAAHVDAVARGELGRRERSVGASVSRRQLAQRVGDIGEEGIREP